MDNINLKIANFSNKLKYLIGTSQLPVGIVYYILKDTFNELQKQYYATLNSISLQESKEQEIKVQNTKQD